MISISYSKDVSSTRFSVKWAYSAAAAILFLLASNGYGQIRPTFADKGEVKQTISTPVINRTATRPTNVSRPANRMLVVLTEPKNAEVFIDGKLASRAVGGEFMKELPSRRTYKIKVSAGPDYGTHEETVTLGQRQAEIVKAALPSRYGTVKIFPAKDGVAISLDGKALPSSRLAVDKENNIITVDKLAPGAHKVVYDLPGYVIYERSFAVSPGSVYTWNLVPEPAVVAMAVETDPDTAVYVDGEYIGKTAGDGVLKSSDIKLGKHEIKLVKDFYKEHKESRLFEYEKPVSVARRLEPLPNSAEFNDNFDTPSQKWTMPASGASIRGGRLSLENASSLVYATNIFYRDFDMTFHLKMDNSGGAAWAVRAKDANSYYLFYLSGPGGRFKNRFLTYIVRDNKVNLDSPADSTPIIFDLKSGGQYQILITAKGSRIEHTIIPADSGKEEKFGFFEDAKNTYPYGGIGFRSIGPEKFSVDEVFVRPR